MVTSDTLFFLVECTSCNLLLILVSSLPWKNPQQCLVLLTVTGELYCTTANSSQLAAILALPGLVVNTCVDSLPIIFQTKVKPSNLFISLYSLLFPTYYLSCEVSHSMVSLLARVVSKLSCFGWLIIRLEYRGLTLISSTF